MKFIFITGGVVSGLGKGIASASLGRLLKTRGLSVTMLKLDPYLNVDPGTMSPYQHGEVFVTDDGAETDLDVGHYERFLGQNLDINCSATAGKIYWAVLNRERRGDYLGGTVQTIPHITGEIKDRVYRAERTGADIALVEIGGTVGDIESQPFLEAIRQVSLERGRENVMFLHLSLIVTTSGELKSKPTQHSVKELLSIGIQPDAILCRTDEPLTQDIRNKIALFCNIAPKCVIQNTTAESIYEVPLLLHREGLDSVVCERLQLGCHDADLSVLERLRAARMAITDTVRIALVGKYTALHDAYLSVTEALAHAGIVCGCHVDVEWVDSETLDDGCVAARLDGCDGILVPGGFGERGIEGKIAAIRYAREHKRPFLGICLGMQLAVVEFARSVAGLAGAHSVEFDPKTPYPVIDLMPEQRETYEKGGTMRLGLYDCVLIEGTVAASLYDVPVVRERHRHRFELNNDYRHALEEAGLTVSGRSPDGSLCEIVELGDRECFIGVQFHPEFLSRPDKPHPVFEKFVCACVHGK